MDQFSVGDIGVKFQIKVLNNDQPGNAKAVNLTNYDTLELEFRRPNNTKFRVEAVPTDTNNLTDTTIEYLDDRDDGSILDFPGKWEYTGVITFNTGIITKGVNKIPFYVHV